jgi:hypothetical protein
LSGRSPIRCRCRFLWHGADPILFALALALSDRGVVALDACRSLVAFRPVEPAVAEAALVVVKEIARYDLDRQAYGAAVQHRPSTSRLGRHDAIVKALQLPPIIDSALIGALEHYAALDI